MSVPAVCTQCGFPLPVPAPRARPDERCPACMVASENARRSGPAFQQPGNVPLPHDIYAIDGSFEREGIRVLRSEWTVRLGVEFPCPYCNNSHTETKTLTVEFPLEPAKSEIQDWVRNKVSETIWQETEGVLCPKCMHFAPRAVLRHFPSGYQEFVERHYRAARRTERLTAVGVVGSALFRGVVGAVIISLIVVFAYAYIRIATDGWNLRKAQPIDWLVIFGIAAIGVSAYGYYLFRRIRSKRSGAPAKADKALERRIAGLDPDAAYRLVVRLYEGSAGSLDLKVASSQFQSLIEDK